jgi:TfoX/Sxy family transcriptional regulator of competence genes
MANDSRLRRPVRPRTKAAPSGSNAATLPDAQAAAAYASLGRRFADQPRVTLPASKRGKFGSSALKVDGKIFAMLVRGALAVKLSPGEVESAKIAGRGEPLAMGRGRVMKEWLLVNEPPQRWYAVAERARAFVAGEVRESPPRTSTGRPREPSGQGARLSRAK